MDGEREEALMTRTYVVTGSASGIGYATKAYLEKQGAIVIGVDVHDADVVVDLASPDGRKEMVWEVAAKTHGVVDAVIANAGLARPEPITVSVNYFGAVATLEGLRPLLHASPAPRAAVVASMAILHPVDAGIVDACLAGDELMAIAAAEGKDNLIYASSKRALARWVRRHAATPEWAGAGIPLNAVAPGVILTPMVDSFVSTPEGREALSHQVPMPLGGYGEADDVAALLAWLTSPENSKVTGQVVFIDAGSDVVLRGDDIW